MTGKMGILEDLCIRENRCHRGTFDTQQYNSVMKTEYSSRPVLHLVALIGLCLSPGCTNSSRSTVPEPVQQAFRERFPTVNVAEWKIKSDHNYEAEFTLEETEIAAKFNAAGEWLETETAISPLKVPPAVNEIVAREFKDYKVIETQSIERPSRALYELHLDNDREIVKVQFSAHGAILNRSVKPR